MAVICLLAYPLTLRRSSLIDPSSKEKGVFILIFGGLSILGNILGQETVNGDILNSRIVGPVIGGIIGGPTVGVLSGLIGGIHRYTMGGFTIVPDLIGNILAGLIGGLVYLKIGKKGTSFIIAFLTGVAAELLHKLLVLWLAKPTIIAEVVVGMYGLNSIFVNSLGIALFLGFVKNIQSNKDIYGANYAEKALDIAKQTLTILKRGFNEKTAETIVKIIYSVSTFDGVAISNQSKYLAFMGTGCEAHQIGKPISSTLAKNVNQMLLSNNVFTANITDELHCKGNCQLNYVAITPLICNKEIIGFLKVYKIKQAINLTELKLVTGLAELLSLQLNNVRLDEQNRLLERAEYSALKSQVNPHFLFNSLSVIH